MSDLLLPFRSIVVVFFSQSVILKDQRKCSCLEFVELGSKRCFKCDLYDCVIIIFRNRKPNNRSNHQLKTRRSVPTGNTLIIYRGRKINLCRFVHQMDLNKDDLHLLARILSLGLVDADPNYLHHLKGFRDLQDRWIWILTTIWMWICEINIRGGG